jgi:hypothetical protein
MLYRCDCCKLDVMVSDQDTLKMKLTDWLFIEVKVVGAGEHTRQFCPKCKEDRLGLYEQAGRSPL